MNVKEIRRSNALALAETIGGKAKFARKMGWTTSRVSQIMGDNANRNIGDSAAAAIEAAFGKEPGWLDQRHQDAEMEESHLPSDEALLLACLRAVRNEIRALNLKLSENDADELLIRATVVLYKFSQANNGELLPASAAIAAARL